MIPPANYEEKCVALIAGMLEEPVRRIVPLCSPPAVTNAVQMAVQQCAGRLRAEARVKELEQALAFIGDVKARSKKPPAPHPATMTVAKKAALK
jgi:hypothetical protein